MMCRILSVCLLVLVAASLLVPASSAAKDKNAFNVTGYVVAEGGNPGSHKVVKLLDAESGKVLDSTTSGTFGKFKFEDVIPGLYLLRVGEVQREILVKNKNLRADVDLTAKDGVYRSFSAEKLAGAIASAVGETGNASGAAVGTGPAAGPNDPQLQQSLAGQYWGYSGSTETQLRLCPGGSFADQAESSYSGRMSDAGGNQTGAWGAAGARGSSGSWSVQGNQQQGTIQLVYANGKTVPVRYRAVDDGCYQFGSTTLCRTGPANCQ